MVKKSKASIENINKYILFPKIDNSLSGLSREHVFVLSLLSELSDLKPNILSNLYKDITGKKLKESRHDVIYRNVKKEVFSVLKIKEGRKDNLYSVGNIELAKSLGFSKKKKSVSGKPYLSKANIDKFNKLLNKPERSITMSEVKKSTAKKKSKFAAATTKKTVTKKKSTAKKVEVEKKSTAKKKVSKKKESVKDRLAKKKASIKTKKEVDGPKKKSVTKKSTSSKLSGKIKALDNTARKGTVRHTLMNVIMKCKTVEDAVGKMYKHEGEERKVASIDVRVAQNIGAIKVI